jgi:hypothetical protein
VRIVVSGSQLMMASRADATRAAKWASVGSAATALPSLIAGARAECSNRIVGWADDRFDWEGPPLPVMTLKLLNLVVCAAADAVLSGRTHRCLCSSSRTSMRMVTASLKLPLTSRLRTAL